MFITKGNGEQEEFEEEKLVSSLKRAGANKNAIDHVVSHIKEELVEGMSTSDIYVHAFNILKKGKDKPLAARYSLKRAIMQLGPSGFPFESLLGEIFKAKGFEVEVGVHLQGKCARHEIDVLGHKDSELIAIESKFHNRAGFKTDMKTALYVNSRWKDLEETDYDGYGRDKADRKFYLVTNTKFTHNSLSYAECSGLKLIGWSYPREGNLEDLIDETEVHPLSCLSTLSAADRDMFFKKGIVLCRDIKGNVEKIRSVGIDANKANSIIEEAELLCKKRV